MKLKIVVSMVLMLVSLSVQGGKLKFKVPQGLGDAMRSIADGGTVSEFLALLQAHPQLKNLTVKHVVEAEALDGETVSAMLQAAEQTEMLAHWRWLGFADWDYDPNPRLAFDGSVSGGWRSDKRSPLYDAVRSGDLEATRALTNTLRWHIAGSEKLNVEGIAANILAYALDIAVIEHQNDIFDYLVEDGAEVRWRHYDHAGLSGWVKSNNVHAVKYAVEHISKIGMLHHAGIDDRIFEATRRGNPDIVKILIGAGDDVDWLAGYENQLIGYVIEGLSGEDKDNYLEILKILIDNGVELKRSDVKKLEELGVVVVLKGKEQANTINPQVQLTH